MEKLQRANLRDRRGVAAVEFAVILPVLVIIFLGGIGVCHLINLKHQATFVAHSAALDAIKEVNLLSDAKSKATRLAAEAGLRNVTVNVSRSTSEKVKVEVIVPSDQNFSLNLPILPSSVKAEAFSYRSAAFAD